jgi:sterol desaturase/sphingolipid hydroxylase (fatty acid hydroxylase superfamily)
VAFAASRPALYTRAVAVTDECREAARSPWRARPGPEAARAIRLFRAFVPERLIFRGHPALPYVLVVPVIGWWLDRYLARPAYGLFASLGLFALGVLAWTLVEYTMHRFLFHLPAKSERAKLFAFVLHGHHHVTPDEPDRLAATPVQFGSLALLMAGLWQLALGHGWMIAMAGTMSGYVAYEAVHYLAHHGPPPAFLRAFVRHHMRHHYERPDRNWGISSPLWDFVFRTRG